MPLTVSVTELEEALRIKREIDALKKRLADLLTGTVPPRRPVLVDSGSKITVAGKARRRARARKKSSDLPTLNPGTKQRLSKLVAATTRA